MKIKPIRKAKEQQDLSYTMEDLTLKDEKEQCNGRIYRAKLNTFINQKGEYIYQERMVPVKRLSCKGCERCGWEEENLSEFIANEVPIIMEKSIEHNALYRLECCNLNYDFETGICDDWDLSFVKIENKEEK